MNAKKIAINVPQPFHKTVPFLCNKVSMSPGVETLISIKLYHRPKKNPKPVPAMCRLKGRLLGRGCRRHGGRRHGTMGRLSRVKLSAGIRMMVLLTLSKWHPGDQGKRSTPPPHIPPFHCEASAPPPLFCFHLHSRASSALWPPSLALGVAQSQLNILTF